MKYLMSVLLALTITTAVYANTGGDVSKSSLADVKALFNDDNCDQILKDYFTTCYSHKRRSAVAVYTEIEGSKVEKDIDKRPSFYTDDRIPKGYEITSEDYTNTGYDRGHFGASDASFDWDQKALESTYKMSNIVPQTPRANRYKFVSLEKLEREMAVKYGVLETLTIAFWDNRPKKIGENGMHVPSAFAKVFSSKGYRECFFVWNTDEYDSKKGRDPYTYKTDCKKVFSLVGTTVGKAVGWTPDDSVELKRLLEFYKTTEPSSKTLKDIDNLIKQIK